MSTNPLELITLLFLTRCERNMVTSEEGRKNGSVENFGLRRVAHQKGERNREKLWKKNVFIRTLKRRSILTTFCLLLFPFNVIFRPSLINDNDFMSSMYPQISSYELEIATDNAKKAMVRLRRLEQELENRGLLSGPSTSEDSHSSFFGSEKEANDHANYTINGYLNMITGIELISKLPHLTSKFGLESLHISKPIMVHVTGCTAKPSPIICRRSKYRTADGSCNNPHNPEWGKAFTPFNRLISPDYGDGINSPRLSASGHELPGPRVLSVQLSPMRRRPSKFFTHLLMQWGQFIDHDMARTAIGRTQNGRGLICCHPAFDRDPELLHPSCLPIDVPKDDPFYSNVNNGQAMKCMSFVRSAPAPPIHDCVIGPREQLNQDTSFLDAGMIYGESDERSKFVRAFEDGRLRTSIVDGREFLPQTTDEDTDVRCNINPSLRLKCFTAGDFRVNMQLSLVTVQGLFLRHHNRIAARLQKLNPKWTDETLFQETKRIVSAQIQHITYNEYLPLILGDKVMDIFDLTLSPHFTHNYDPRINPSIFAGFSSAGFRLHTTVISTIPFRDADGNVVGDLDLSDTFLNPSMIYARNSYPEMLYGLTGVPMASFDSFFSTQLTTMLFRPFNATFGLDLVSINIQRGRDHGIPGYNTWRKVCGLPTFSSFEGLNQVMDPEAVTAMSHLYESVDDIDLFVGGNAEHRLKRAIVGPTFACIIAEQFRRLKFGDRFWYENAGQDGSFTHEQLSELKRTSLAAIFCEDEVTNIQKVPFIRSFDKRNERVDCDQIPRLNLKSWKDLR